MIRYGLLLVAGLLVGCTTTEGQAPVTESDKPIASTSLPPVDTGQGRHAPILDASASPHKRLIRESSAPPVGYYRIQEGDTLYTIAFLRQLDVTDLAEWNHIADPTYILAGELLRVTPPTGGAQVPQVVGTKRSLSEPPARLVEKTSILLADDQAPEGWSWPSQGDLLSRFGESSNKGIDIEGKLRHPVFSAAKGMVVYAGTGLRGYGKLIIIRHGRNLLSAYAHNSKILVYEGQSVRRGQQVAEMGNSDSDRVKLHFEIRERGKPVDPMNYLPKAS